MDSIDATGLVKEKITEFEFYDIWRGVFIEKGVPLERYKKYYRFFNEKWHVHLDDIEIDIKDENKIFYITDTDLLSITLERCLVEGYIYIQRCTVHGELIIDNLKINGDLHFLRCNFKNKLSTFRLESYNLTINSCNIFGDININSSKIYSLFEVVNSQIYANIDIRYSKIRTYKSVHMMSNGNVSIFQSTIEHELNLDDFTLWGDINVSNSSVNILSFYRLNILGDLRLIKLSLIDESFRFTYVNLYGNFIFRASSVRSRINLYKSFFYRSIYCEENQLDDIVDMEECNVGGTLMLRDNGMKKLKIHKESWINTIRFEQSTPIAINILDARINKLLFSQTISNKDTVFNCVNCTIHKVVFRSFVNSGYILFNSIKSTRLYFRIVSQKRSRYSLAWNKDKSKESLFKIMNSDVGKTHFVDCDLRGFDRFEFSSSKIVDMFVGGTLMPEYISVPKEKLSDELSEQQLGYAQLKKVHDNRGDSVTALEYAAKELESYRKSLVHRKDKKSERFNLWINKVSSNYGTDYWKALKLTLVVLCFCYAIYCMLVGFFPGYDLDLFGELFSRMFEFLNPIRKSEFLKEEINGFPKRIPYYARIWDYFSRIVVSYFVYQTVQAFRKHGKK